ncbi:NAD(P)/FAD-dependent oxidoreductase [Mesorhizobium sp. IMUNJ 23232]|uniref:NAD(P)/FAD-dependent oxidoreductase n=1 Tax=Mesorhizobium sp. IMUNJ 23232 TaxID=3376064 RepID=UPI0037AE0A70
MSATVRATPQRSGWLRTAVPAPRLPALDRDLSADVIIVGAGYAGLNAAIRCNELGLQAVVLEAEDAGFGGSGRNGGQVIPGLKYDPEELLRMFGEPHGARLVEFAGKAAERTFDVIERYRMDCEAERSGWLQPAVDDATIETVTRRAKAWQDASGVPIRLLDRDQIQAATGTAFYRGGWIDPRGGQLQPLSYARELARVAVEGGANVFSRSPVTDLARREGRWRARVNGHELSAPLAVVCTNAYTAKLVPGLGRSIIPASSIICSTKPLPDALRHSIMPGGLPISDARRLLNYMRFDPGGRFLIGARGSFGLHEPESYFHRLRKTATRIFPQLQGIEWEDAWGGRFAVTVDHVPHLHNPEPGLFVALGCNGRGVAMLSQLGRVLAELADGLPHDQAPFPVQGIRPIPLHFIRRPGLEVVTLWYRTLDAFGR